APTNTKSLRTVAELERCKSEMTLADMSIQTIQRRTEVPTSTTPRITTMTTKPTREFSRDLVHNDQWPLFRARPAHEGSVDPVCAVTISWRASLTGRASLRQNVSSGLGNMLASLADKLKYSAIMYFVHRTLQPKSAIILHKRIWKSVPDHQLPTG